MTHTLHPFTLPYYWLSPSILAQLHYIMAKKTLSEHVKKAKQTQLKETKPKEAVDMYQHEQSIYKRVRVKLLKNMVFLLSTRPLQINTIEVRVLLQCMKTIKNSSHLKSRL